MNLSEHDNVILTFDQYINCSVKTLLEEMGVSESIVTEALEKHFAEKDKQALQSAIFRKNSLESIVGKQADLQELLIVTHAKLIIGTAKVKSFAELNKLYQEVAEPFSEILEKIESGEISLVHHSKQMNAQDVINEAMLATNQTAAFFQAKT